MLHVDKGLIEFDTKIDLYNFLSNKISYNMSY